MVLSSLVLCIIYIDTDTDKLTFHSISAMTSPLIVLFASSLLKCILLRTTKTYLWCSLCTFALIEIALFILKVDFACEIDWVVIVSPLGFIFLSLMICSIQSGIARYRANDCAGIVFSIIVMGGCFSGIILVIIFQELLVFGENRFIEFEVWGWITISLLGTGYSRKCGGWVLGIVFENIEVDYWHFRYPIKKADMSTRSNTV